MTYVKIGETTIPADVSGRIRDEAWDGRESKSITCEMTFEEARDLFVDGLSWSILYQEGERPEEEYDNSDFSIAGPLTDNKDGTITAKMGKYTNEELLLMEVLG